MEISKSLQEELNKHIPKKEQQSFVELAVKKELRKYVAMKTDVVELYVDGGSRGNPGPAGGGFAAYKAGEKVLEGSEYYGEKTNNQAEYLALRTALRETYSQFPDSNIRLRVKMSASFLMKYCVLPSNSNHSPSSILNACKISLPINWLTGRWIGGNNLHFAFRISHSIQHVTFLILHLIISVFREKHNLAFTKNSSAKCKMSNDNANCEMRNAK